MPSGIECTDIENGIRCAITGELDLASEELVSAEIDRVLGKNPAVFVVDLSGLEFIDSTGLRVLLKARNSAGDNGTRLLLTTPPEAIQRVFDIANVNDLFEYVDDAADRNGDGPE